MPAPGAPQVGLLQLRIAIPGARSLKDRRQAVHSLRDRIRARFDVACHDVTADEVWSSATLIVTTAGNDASVLASTLDKIRSVAEAHGACRIEDVQSEVLRWPDPVAGLAGEGWKDV